VAHLNLAGTVAEKMFEPLALYDEPLVLILKLFTRLSIGRHSPISRSM
jgi:hypothetical protein